MEEVGADEVGHVPRPRPRGDLGERAGLTDPPVFEDGDVVGEGERVVSVMWSSPTELVAVATIRSRQAAPAPTM